MLQSSKIHLMFLCKKLTSCLLVVSVTESHPIRLVGSDQTCSGRIEILYNNTWGTVCEDGWSTNSSNAEVACRQLTCGPPLDYYLSSSYARSTGPIWLDVVNCSGSESSLNECQHRQFGENNCSHYNDISVSCLGENNCFIYLIIYNYIIYTSSFRK